MQHIRSGMRQRRKVNIAGAAYFLGTVTQPRKTQAAISREHAAPPTQSGFYRLMGVTFIMLLASALAGVMVAVLSFG